MPLFSPAELRTFSRQALTDDECAIVLDLTDDALRGEVGDRLTDPPQPGVRSVALAVAARALTNAAGVRSEQAGSMSVSYTDALTGVVLTAGELRRLRRAVGMASSARALNIGPDPAPLVDLRRWPW